MTNFNDCSVGLAKETTYGTSATPTRWFEFLTESLDYNKNVVQGKGLRVGQRTVRFARRVIPTSDAGGDFAMECVSKGMGLLWEQLMGTGVSTLVSASTYQQNFTFGDAMPSATWQKGLPRVDGTVDPYTFTGAKVDSFEVTFGQEILTVSATIDARAVTTATAYAAPSYATEPVNLYHFANASLSTGTFTAPTTTVLAAAATPIASVRSGSFKVSHNLDSEGYVFGSGGKKYEQVPGIREISGTLEVEYDSTTFRDAVINDTGMALVITYTGGALTTGNETLQFAFPEIRFDGKLPAANEGKRIVQSLSFAGGVNTTVGTQPMWVCARTADAAL